MDMLVSNPFSALMIDAIIEKDIEKPKKECLVKEDS